MLTSRQLCVLMPSRVANFKPESVVHKPAQRCLFGKPDPDECQKMCQQELCRARQVFLDRFCLDDSDNSDNRRSTDLFPVGRGGVMESSQETDCSTPDEVTS